MELLALFSVNLISGIALYIFFSLRYSRAIQKRDQGILDSMRSIAGETRTQSVEIFEMAQEKQKSIYQLTRRADELLAEMHLVEERIYEMVTNKSATQKKVTKKNSTSTKKASNNPKSPVIKRTTNKHKVTSKKVSKKKVNLNIEPAFTQVNEAPTKSNIPTHTSIAHNDARTDGYDATKILDQMGTDKLELSHAPKDTESAYQVGSVSKPLVSKKLEVSKIPLNNESSTGFLQTAGKILRKIMGDDSISQPIHQAQNTETKLVDEPSVSFQDMLTEGIKDSQKDAVLNQPKELLPNFEDSNEKEEQTIIYSPPIRKLDQPLFSDPNLSRNEKIRIMIQKGFSEQDIITATNASLAEVRLFSNLPKKEKQPRRHRLKDE